MVPRAGLEPARYRYRWILSPLRLPISPPGHCLTIISKDRMPCKDFFKKATRNSINKKRLFLRKSHTSKWRARFVSCRPVTFQYLLHLSESFDIPIHSVFIDGVFIVCFIYKHFRISSMIYVPIIQ